MPMGASGMPCQRLHPLPVGTLGTVRGEGGHSLLASVLFFFFFLFPLAFSVFPFSSFHLVFFAFALSPFSFPFFSYFSRFSSLSCGFFCPHHHPCCFLSSLSPSHPFPILFPSSFLSFFFPLSLFPFHFPLSFFPLPHPYFISSPSPSLSLSPSCLSSSLCPSHPTPSLSCCHPNPAPLPVQVGSYGGRLYYTLTYTPGGQRAPLPDADIQITVQGCWLGWDRDTPGDTRTT